MIPSIDEVLKNIQHYTNPATVRIHHPDLYEQVINLPYDNFSKKLHAFYHGAPEPCPICGKMTKYVNFKTGYRTYCSRKCMARSEETLNNRRKTNVQRYGVQYPAQSESVRAKMKETCIERYGVEHAMKSSEIVERSRHTCMEKYGVSSTGGYAPRLEKTRLTNQERYGSDWYLGTAECTSRVKRTKLERYGSESYNNPEQARKTRLHNIALKYGAISYDGTKLTMPCSNPECRGCEERIYKTSLSMHIDRTKYGCELCTKLFPPHSADYGVSMASQQFFRLLDSMFFSRYETYYHSKNREFTVGKYRLDYYVPELELCIEFYGDDWHANPAKYNSDDCPIPQFKRTAEEIWKHDSERVRYLNDLGISVITIWASEYANGTAHCIIADYMAKLKNLHNYITSM